MIEVVLDALICKYFWFYFCICKLLVFSSEYKNKFFLNGKIKARKNVWVTFLITINVSL